MDCIELEADVERIVAKIAARCQAPVPLVAELYARKRERLGAQARVTMYLDVFATREVQRLLDERGAREPAA